MIIQGHRGARGLLPENTILSCCKAVELGVDGLEIDVVVSKDNQIVVSHEPWMSPHFCSFPDGKPLDTVEERNPDTPSTRGKGILLRNLTVSDIQKYDCGSRGNPLFPTQKPVSCFKPTLYELISAVHAFCEKEKREKPFWNIEVKSHPKWYGRLVPPPLIFVRLLLKELDKIGLTNKNAFYISSFDPQFLRVFRKQAPSVKLAFLTENRLSFKKNIRKLGFTPPIYSPYFKFINKKMVQQAHQKGVKIMTWTVNDAQTADILRGWQVDGLITDFPNLM